MLSSRSKHPTSFSKAEVSVPFDHCCILSPEVMPGTRDNKYAESLVTTYTSLSYFFPILCFVPPVPYSLYPTYSSIFFKKPGTIPFKMRH